MKSILIILSIVTLISNVTLGNNNHNLTLKPITISGYVPDSCIKTLSESLDIYFHNNFNDQLWHEAEIIPIHILHNRFSVKIQPKGEISYFQIRDALTATSLLFSLQMDAFLINAGDSICINFKTPNFATFSGKGSEKLNYQFFAGNLVLNWGNRIRMNKNLEEIEYWKEVATEHLTSTMDSLNTIKETLTKNTFNVLIYNTASAIYDNHIDHLSNGNFYGIPPDSIYLKALKNELITMDLIQRGLIPTDSIILNNSPSYISYISKFQLIYNQTFSNKKNPSFIKEYNKIIKDYNSALRDKILAYSINKSYETGNTFEFIKQALNLIKDPISKTLLESIYNAKTPGSNAYNFSFEDKNGKKIELQNLKGKVVILEAWFNGCLGCALLTKEMHPVLDYFKNNKNVIFISLCVDKNKERFIEGVRSGKYGSENSIYAYTNGQGWEHPMCLQYKWSGYPNMLYIDKMGKIITANTIFPNNLVKINEIISLINNNIN